MLFKLRLFSKNVCKMYKNIDKYKVKRQLSYAK